MLELAPSAPAQYKQSFAGDVLSVATYLARLAPALDVELYTAIGNDPFSHQLLGMLQDEGVSSRHVARHPHKMLGLYMIRNDECGEREFIYWRNDSAAKTCLQLMPPKELPRPDVFYLSGISLAILSHKDQETLMSTMQYWHMLGTRIVFDPNHRPKLWRNSEHAKTLYQRVFSLTSIALPGMDDLQNLYGFKNAQTAIHWLQELGCSEVIVKDGGNNIHYLYGGDIHTIAIKPVTDVVDATAAGDSFAAGFLASRLNGASPDTAISFACHLSATVLMHKGAIIPKQTFSMPLAHQE